MPLRLRLLRLVNLLKRRPSILFVELIIVSENMRRLVIERNCLETSDREFKYRRLSLSSSLMMNLNMVSQHSSGNVAATAFVAKKKKKN
jgi:hypothetical protein